MKITHLDRAALEALARRDEHTATVNGQPFTRERARRLAELGLATVWSKEVVGVPLTKVTITEAGMEALA